MMIERDYASLQIPDLFYGDVIVSPCHCIVLLSMWDFNDGCDVDGLGRRFIALGLQFLYCYIIVHSIGSSNKSVIILVYFNSLHP